MKTLTEAKVIYAKFSAELTKKKVPCRLKLNEFGKKFELVVECGRDFPDRLANKIYTAARIVGLKDGEFGCCAEQCGGTDHESTRINGGPKRY